MTAVIELALFTAHKLGHGNRSARANLLLSDPTIGACSRRLARKPIDWPSHTNPSTLGSVGPVKSVPGSELESMLSGPAHMLKSVPTHLAGAVHSLRVNWCRAPSLGSQEPLRIK